MLVAQQSVYRDELQAAEIRRARLEASRAAPAEVARVYAHRQGRILAGATGIAGIALVVVVLFWRPAFATYALVASWVAALVAFAYGAANARRRLSREIARTFGIIGASLGLLIELAWLVNQGRIMGECKHWESALRSLEGHFAGTELHRGLLRVANGEEVCIVGSRMMCNEWHSDSVRWPWIYRALPNLLAFWTPVMFALAFAALLVWFALTGTGGAAGVSL